MKSRNSRNDKAFTLIEILVVLAIMGFMMVLAGKGLRNPNADLRQVVREVAALTNSLHNKAKLQNLTYRLAIEMNEKEPDKIWVESSTTKVLFAIKKEEKRQFEEEKPKSPFTHDKRAYRKGIFEMPKGLEIDRVEYLRTDDAAINGGVAYIHFMPEGLVEEAAIHLKSGQLNWTISVHPVTGRVDTFTSDISLKEIREQ